MAGAAAGPAARDVDGGAAIPLLLGLFALGVCLPLAARTLAFEVAPPHFGLLADALLHGRLYVAQPVYDGVVHSGHTYLPFGPLPAVLMIPAVLAAGPGLPVMALGLVAVVVAAVACWLTWPRLGVPGIVARTWLTLATFAGTAALSAAVINSGYFVAHLVVIACLAWALLLALDGRRALLCGVLVAMAGLTRTNALLAAPALAGLYWSRNRRLLDLAGVLGPLAPAIALLGVYNLLRFGSVLDSGYGSQALANPELIALRQQGLFSLRHLPLNLYYLLAAPPAAAGPGLPFPWLRPSPWGMGLIFVSPWLLLAVLARGRVAALLALGLVLTLLPSLLYYGVGWIQFGYRYGLDGLPFLAALAALGVAAGGRRLLPVLATVSILVNLAGAAWLVSALGA